MNDTNDGETTVNEDEYRTTLAFFALEAAKMTKVINDSMVSMLNNERALEVKTDDEHDLSRQTYLNTKEIVNDLAELSESLDETDDDEQSVASHWADGEQEE